MFETLLGDFRYGLRTLAAKPGFTIAALLTLGVSIGANTLVFSLVNSIYLAPLPYRDDGALIDIQNSYPKMGLSQAGVSIPDYVDRHDGLGAVEASALYSSDNFNLADNGPAERIRGSRATPSLFDTLGVVPAQGRVFTPDEAQVGRDKVVVLGDRLWRNRFNADAAVVGRDIRLDGTRYRVIGVLPPGFFFPDQDTQVFVPFAFTPEQKSDAQRGYEFSSMVARLKKDATMGDVKQQSDLIIRRNLERIGTAGANGPQFADFMRNAGFTVSVQSLRSELGGTHAQILLLLQLAVALVLLIACANIANLLLARLSARRKELSVRAALGASRVRIARQLLIEAIVLAFAGAALGLVIAALGERLVGASGMLPDWVTPSLDAHVLGFTVLVALVAALLCGLFPVLSSASTNPQAALREAGRIGGGGRSARRVRDALVVTQLALAVALLASAGLLLRSFGKVLDENPGFDTHGVLTAAVSLSKAKYPDAAARSQAMAAIGSAARALPGVAAVGIVDARPLAGNVSGSSYRVDGGTDQGAAPHAYQRVVDTGYFATMRIPLLAGRTFTDSDWNSAERVIVIDALLAQKRFPSGDAVGRALNLAQPGGGNERYTIIGVVGTIKTGDLGKPVDQESYYLDYGQHPVDTVALLLRATAAPAALAAPLRAAIRGIDAEQPVFDMMTLDQRLHLSLSGRRVPMQLIGAFAALALLLAAIGIYGVLAFAVAERTGEFGVRMAIGASAQQILRQVIGSGARLIGAGLGIGLLLAALLGALLKSQLFGVDSIDPTSLAVVVGTLAVVASFACWLPARRAARVSPTEALRHQ